jgi:hypothetical protein
MAKNDFGLTLLCCAKLNLGVAKRHRILASYEVAGLTPNEFMRPEGTPDSVVPSGRFHFCNPHPARRAGLMSSRISRMARVGKSWSPRFSVAGEQAEA